MANEIEKIWYKLYSIQKKRAEKGDEYKESVVCKWKATNVMDYDIEITMKFDSELDAQEYFKQHNLRYALGERFALSISGTQNKLDVDSEKEE